MNYFSKQAEDSLHFHKITYGVCKNSYQITTAINTHP